jgi:hypothetical protein
MHAVYRVNWLRAKARFNRWEEEEKIVKSEMDWTIRWFENQQLMWEKNARESIEKQQEGHACYAWKQEEMWSKFKQEAISAFSEV